MNTIMKNARGRKVVVRQVTPGDLQSLANRIISHSQTIDGLDGVITIGSTVTSAVDVFSDLDLRFFADEPADTTTALEDILDQMGAIRDDDASSIHFPLDYPARLLDGLCVEFTVSSIDDTRKQIDQVVHGQHLDDGLIHSLRIADIGFDRSGRIHTLLHYARDLSYPRAYLRWITSIGLDCEMKLLRQAVARQDWHQAMTWLTRAFLCCARILFARNSRFFPGHKRLLYQTIPALEYKPDGFVEFWQGTFSRGVGDWQSVVERTQQFVTELKGYGQFSEESVFSIF
jgi:hypothetical protein